MNTFIESLKKYSILNFPVNEVSTFIMESNIQKYNLAKYEHFSKKMYTRNRIYKDEHFEILFFFTASLKVIIRFEVFSCFLKARKQFSLAPVNEIKKTMPNMMFRDHKNQ